MSTWYYSDHQRNRLGPVQSNDLAELHRSGQLAPDVLVWREGMADWRPWREMMADVLAGPAGGGAPALEPALAAAGGYNPYELVERPVSSPYAPPAANVSAMRQAVLGGQVVYARFLKRFAANAVDGLVAGIAAYTLLIPLMLAMGVGLGAVMGGDAAALAGFGFIGLMYAIQIGVPAVYYGLMQSSERQATLGKRLADVKIVRSDGSPIGFWRGFLRSIALVLSILLTCGLGALATALMTVMTEKRQGLHDLICDTVVVDQYAFTEHADYQDERLNTATKVVLGLYLLLIVGFVAVAFLVGMFAAAAR